MQATTTQANTNFSMLCALVCRTLGVEFEELSGNGRRPAVVLARGIISHLARKMTVLSFPEIARGLGRPTHSTIIAACNRLKSQMAPESQVCVDIGGTVFTIRELVDLLEKQATERFVPAPRALYPNYKSLIPRSPKTENGTAASMAASSR
jgi:hypothetical protein